MCIINTLALVFYCKFLNRYKNVYMWKWMSVCMNLREFLDFVRGVCEWMDGRPQCKYIVYCYMKLYDLLWNLRKTKIQLSWIECYNCYALITCRHKLFSTTTYMFIITNVPRLFKNPPPVFTIFNKQQAWL